MTILITIVVVLAAFLAFVASRPGTFRLERSVKIDAPADKIYAYVQDFQKWRVWSPYENIDPTMQRTLTGASEGKGAIYEWNGTAKAGQGRMEILEASPPSKIVIDLRFMKPFRAHNTAEFTFVQQPRGTTATWAMYGPLNFMAKFMHLFFSMDSIVGKDFEAGLANLKAAAEK